MTINRAIKNLELLKINLTNSKLPYPFDAIQLGIEALKRLKEHREEHIDITFRALEGETLQ